MWKHYINFIQKRNLDYDYREYCVWFASIFSYTIYSLNEYINIIEKDNGDLLPISKNLTNYFYSHNIEYIINLLYHINELKNLDFIIMDNHFSNNIEKLFYSRNNSLYFFNIFSYDNEILLSSDDNNATLLYLFFYFCPTHHNQDLLHHSIKKIPLISCNKITFNHFEMLLYLMKSFDEKTFGLLSVNYNLNLLMIEDFCKSATEIYTFLEHDEWYEILPINRIKILFKENCYLNFLEMKKISFFSNVPTLHNFIEYLQKECEFLQLKDKLTSKGQLIEKQKIIKI